MKIKYSPHILLIATCLLTAVACRKPAQPVNGIQSSDQGLITEARNWYQARVEQNSAGQGDSVSVSSLPLKRFPQTVYWDKAITIHSSNADRILLPLAYSHPVLPFKQPRHHPPVQYQCDYLPAVNSRCNPTMEGAARNQLTRQLAQISSRSLHRHGAPTRWHRQYHR